MRINFHRIESHLSPSRGNWDRSTLPHSSRHSPRSRAARSSSSRNTQNAISFPFSSISVPPLSSPSPSLRTKVLSHRSTISCYDSPDSDRYDSGDVFTQNLFPNLRRFPHLAALILDENDHITLSALAPLLTGPMKIKSLKKVEILGLLSWETQRGEAYLDDDQEFDFDDEEPDVFSPQRWRLPEFTREFPLEDVRSFVALAKAEEVDVGDRMREMMDVMDMYAAQSSLPSIPHRPNYWSLFDIVTRIILLLTSSRFSSRVEECRSQWTWEKADVAGELNWIDLSRGSLKREAMNSVVQETLGMTRRRKSAVARGGTQIDF